MTTKVVLLMILTGLCWGTWPLIMRNSGVMGNTNSFVWAGIMFLVLAPFAVHQGLGQLHKANWWVLLVASAMCAVGAVALNTGLAVKMDRSAVATAMVVMLLTQVGVQAIYQAFSAGELSPRRILGMVAALAAVKLLS